MGEMIDTNGIKVSIVMPVYNASIFLGDSVGDVLYQTYGEFELICVDDGSTDDSGKILDGFAAGDDRIKVVHQENRGGGAARNRGMEEATGKYILFLDADDRFENNLLEVTVRKAEEEVCDVVVFDADAFDYTTGKRRKAQWLIQDEELNAGNPFSSINNSVWNKLFLKENIDKYNIRFTERKAAYSTSFVACALMIASGICIAKTVLLHYRMNNPKSNVTNEDKDPTAIVDALLDVRHFLETNGIFPEKKEAYLYLCEKEIATRLSFMKTVEGYGELYRYAHDNCGKMVALDEENSLLEEMGLYKLNNINNYDLDEWLYGLIGELRGKKVIEKETFFLPCLKDNGSVRIAIYGAGNVGKDFFIQSMRRDDVEPVCWVDRDFERIGFPVQSPNMLLKIDYDFVVIAVSDNRTAGSIKHSLVDLGISETRIFYKRPETL